MRKLHLTSFEFKTGENVYNELRLVVAPSNAEAYEVAKIGFGAEHPQSELLGLRVLQTYGDVNFKEHVFERGRKDTFDNLIDGLKMFPLEDIFEGLKRNYSDGQRHAYLQDCIDNMSREVFKV